MSRYDNPFNEVLKTVEREITDLKTSHRRPLGALNFFKDFATIPVNLTLMYGAYVATVLVTVEIDKPSVTPPIVQFGYDVPNGFPLVDFYGVTVNDDYSKWVYNLNLFSVSQSSASMKVGAVSSQEIKSITWEVR